MINKSTSEKSHWPSFPRGEIVGRLSFFLLLWEWGERRGKILWLSKRTKKEGGKGREMTDNEFSTSKIFPGGERRKGIRSP